jgi:spore coat polysaccharide biosynthesis predicted glycosyltransferase SpsG
MRANASKSIGAGHVMRLCAIAEELISRGNEVSLCADFIELDWVINYLSRIDFHKVVIRDSGLDQFDTSSHMVITDSYLYDFLADCLIKHPWRNRVLVWDSFTPVVNSEIYIVPSMDNPPILGSSTKVLSGTKFIPLRRSIQKRDWNLDNSPKKLIVLAGGSDPFGLIPHLHNIFSELELCLSTTFVGPRKDSNSSLFRFVEFSENVDLLLNEADFVISTASSTSYEILARGIPLGIIQATDNQASNYSNFVAANLAVGLGTRVKDSYWKVDKQLLSDFLSDFKHKFDGPNSRQQLIDLQGSIRIANALEAAWMN